MPRSATEFVTVRSEGGLVPPDLLARIAAGDPELGHLDAASYGVTGRLQEHIASVWARVRSFWGAFRAIQERLGETESGVTETREQWMLPLLRELGYGRLEFRAAGETVGQRTYPISHRAAGVPIHLTGFRQDLDRASSARAGTRLSPHAMMQEYLNAAPPLYGLVSNGLRLRLLREHASLTRLAYLEFDLEAMLEGGVYSDFVLLFLVVHRTRLPLPGESACPLETWREKARAKARAPSASSARASSERSRSSAAA
ncbi:MAG: hypothetical protein KatS3mg060_3501 [Dehalococcoidia bacterium]|jgi:hypothetical protein|nr:MAG: hypothetical protein KatS3mg060_3501 [Dehalococcoidia bacterium]